MAAKLRAQAPSVASLLLLAAAGLLLVLAATVADASRPLKEEPSSEGDDVPTVVVESSVGDIQTVVRTAVDDGAGRNKLVMSIVDMLGGIKDSGPSPGAGH